MIGLFKRLAMDKVRAVQVEAFKQFGPFLFSLKDVKLSEAEI